MDANVSLTGSLLYQTGKKKCEPLTGRKLGPFYQSTDKDGIATFEICMPCKALELSFKVISDK